MSPDVTNLLPDFERQIYVNIAIKEMAEEANAMQGNK